MKRISVLLLVFVWEASPAFAGGSAAPLCLDPSKPYEAVWVSGRTVDVTAKRGKPRAEVHIETDCIGIDGHARIKVQARAVCLAAGDIVQLKRSGDPVQTCNITKVSPTATYAAATVQAATVRSDGK
ncbi:MAG: hypothetical protein WDN03_19055 [Rhizomicrobium sp.]